MTAARKLPPLPDAPPVPSKGRHKTAEGDFKAALTRALGAMPGVRVWRNQSGVLKSGRAWIHLAPKGSADLLGVAAPDGLLLSIEVKAGKVKDNGLGTLAAQAAWAESMGAAGAVHVQAHQRVGEEIGDAVARCLRELDGAIAEARSRRACSDAEVRVAANVAAGGVAGDE